MKLKRFVIDYQSTLKEALSMLEINQKKFLICTTKKNKVIGTLTDGDIRRALLDNISLNHSIEKICNKKYNYLNLNSSFKDICTIFKSDKIDFMPIVTEDLMLLNILTKKQFHLLLLENLKLNLSTDFTALDAIKLEHEIYNTPWGFYKSTILTSHAQSKIITVFPNSELSLQEHKKREEHWIIIKGLGKVILGESLIDIYPGKYIYIPKGCKHQIINDSDENIIFSEVQLGEYFGEDDIIRYSDKYGRK